MTYRETRPNETGLFYRERGSGIPCLVMHGGLGLDHTYLEKSLAPLGDVLRLVYYDHRGNGRSDRPPVGDLTLDRWVEDADLLRAHLGVERVAVLGHSFGACIGMEYALRYPDRVSHLMIVESAPALDYWDEVDAIIANRELSPDTRAAWQTMPTDDAGLGAWLGGVAPLYVHPDSDPEILAPLLGDTRFDHAAWARSVEVFNGAFNVSDRLGQITALTLVIVGREDFICPPSQAVRMRDGIPGAELVVFERSGHFPFVEEPDAFFDTVRDWMHRVNESTGPDPATRAHG